MHGTLPPVVDADTGILFTGDVNETTVRAVAAVDPKLPFISRPADGRVGWEAV